MAVKSAVSILLRMLMTPSLAFISGLLRNKSLSLVLIIITSCARRQVVNASITITPLNFDEMNSQYWSVLDSSVGTTAACTRYKPLRVDRVLERTVCGVVHFHESRPSRH